MSDRSSRSSGLSASELADVEAIFAEAAPLEALGRTALLDARCSERPRLRAELEALLDSHDRLGDFLHPPTADGASGPVLTDAVAHQDGLDIGASVGPYRLISLVGEGGMGRVYLAERVDGLFSHRVAIKVTRASIYGDNVRRFRAERQILASLQHSNIVTLLDGGTTSMGEAYLVMEHVAGEPITEHCRRHRLGLEARLRLVQQVAAAVQFAHQHGIVHRDLKPANILVTADGVAKVLDFGVAKLLESEPGTEPTLTRAFPGPLTPNYASPEQLRGLPVTTASDVYALGVLTYEVLTGSRPYDTSGKTLDEMLSLVVDTEPPRPSAVSAIDRGMAPAVYAPARLTGDLDAVVLKAMSKEPERRYSSAGALADDLERVLTGHLVLAREPSVGYVLRRLARRNKVAVTTAIAALLAIVAALGVAVWQRHRAQQAQARAERRFTETRQLANALIFKIHDAVVPLPGSTPVRQTIVSEALAYLERLEADSGGDRSLQLELSRAYRQIGFILGNVNTANLGDRAAARRHFEKARQLTLPLAAGDHAVPGAAANLASIDILLSPLVKQSSGVEAAAALAREAVQHASALAAAQQTAEARSLLGRALFGLALVYHPLPESAPFWERARDHYEADLNANPTDVQHRRNVALVCKYLGGVQEDLRNYDAALGLYRRALELDEQRAAAKPDDRVTQFDLAVSLSTLATATEREGKYEDAAQLYQRGLRIRQALHESDPKDVLSRTKVGYMQMRLALLEVQRGNAAQARELAQASIEMQEVVAAKTKDMQSRRDLAAARVALGLAERHLGRRALGCSLIRQGLAEFQAAPSTAYLENLEARAAGEVRACGDTRQ